MKKDKILDVLLLCLKIILPILIMIPLAFFSYRLIEGRIEDLANIGNDSYHSGTGLYIFLSHVTLLVINAVLLIIGCIGLLIAKKHKACSLQNRNIITFRCLALAPVCSQLLYVIINVIVLNIS